MTDKLINQLRLDYENFPYQQSYHLYAQEVYFKDPLTEFRGIQRYQAMIAFMARWFRCLDLDLHQIDYTNSCQISTRWTLRWVAPLPWQPAMVIVGSSQLELNSHGQIVSHVDSWDCSPWQVLQQIWSRRGQKPGPG